MTSAFSFDNVYACHGGTIGATTFDNPGSGTYAWQCVELSARYLWAIYGIWAGPGAGVSTGADLVSVVHAQHPSIPVGQPGPGSVPIAGDVISLGPNGGTGSAAGHTAVVIASNASTGQFTIMSENSPLGTAGEQNLQVDLSGVHNGSVSFFGKWTSASWLELAAATPPPSIGDGTRFTESGSTSQYISWRGASLPLSFGDAQAYDAEGDTGVGTDTSGYLAGHPATNMPSNTVVRIVGTPSQYLFNGTILRPIDAPATSSCLLFAYGQSSPSVVPTMWADPIPIGSGAGCSLPDGTRFTESGSSQYISSRGASLPLSFGDAQAYDAEGDTGVAVMAPGYVSGHPATNMPPNTVVRIVGTPSQYLFNGTTLRPIDAPATSSCLLFTRGQSSPAVVPTMWSDPIPISSGVGCSLPDETRFVESGSLAQFISWRGASLPLSYGDAQGYDAEGNAGVVDMAPGYVSGHPATNMPPSTVVRIVGTPSQYLFNGTTLKPIGSPPVSTCLLNVYHQSNAAVVPSMWSDPIPIGSAASCRVPSAPTRVGAASTTVSATVAWTAPTTTSGFAIVAYAVAISPGGRTVMVGGSTLHATFVRLGGGTYSFKVRAKNAVGWGPWSSPSNALTIDTAQGHPASSGYWMLGSDGTVYPFGNAARSGSAPGPAVAIAARNDGHGYWTVDAAGNVSHFGTTTDHGGHPGLRAGENVSTISATPSGNGYWLFTNRGRAFPYGDAHFYGDMSAVALNGPIVGSVATPTGHGYYMVGSDGGVFSFGDAHFHGSTGAMHLNRPIVGISPTPDNHGYWLVASDGGVFAFTAPFRGSMGATHLNRPVNGLVAYGNGYLMVASDGGVFDFSNKAFVGSLANTPPTSPIIGIAPT